MNAQDSGPQGSHRRRIRNLLLAPKAQFRSAFLIFAVGFTLVTILFGLMLYRVSDIISLLIQMTPNPTQVSDALAGTSLLLWSSYLFLVCSFLVSAIFLGLVITHRYLGPAVAIRRFIRKMIDGEAPAPLKLRKNDELQDLAADLNELAAKIKNRSSNETRGS